MVRDNGGAIAQKGFNYQNHVISLTAIRNYTKNNFEIFVESDDDFEVLYDDNYHAYIQVKGKKRIGIEGLLKKNKDKCSILEKHLTSGDLHSKYKIVVFHFTEKDLSEMQENTSEELFEHSLKLSKEQTGYILKQLGDKFSTKLASLEGDYEDLKNNLSSLLESNGLSDRKFRDYKKLKGSGTNLNKDLLAIYLIYMNLIANNSEFKIPFAIDSFVKNEIDTISQERMFRAIGSYFLTLKTQTFFSVIRENLYKIDGDYCETRVESPLLKEDRYEEISREIIEFGV